ncbi:MAG: MFS transporter, partial [Maricaulaceae bacterium]
EQANYGMLALYAGMMFWAVMVGRWLERFSAKTLSIYGALAFGIGFSFIALATHPLMIIAAILIPLGFGFTAAGPFLANVLATRWFTEKRGRALGISAIATSAGGAIIVPIFTAMMGYFGWREATLILAAIITLMALLISALIIIGRPEDIGQHPDGALDTVNTETPDTPEDNKSFLTRPEFWLISLGAGLLLGSDQALLISLFPYGTEQGFSRQDTAYVMSVMTTSAIAGKLIVGWLAERWDKRILFALVCSCNIAFLLVLLTYPSYTGLLVTVGLVGLAIGGVYPVWTTLTAACFGRTQFSKVIGAMNVITIPFMIASIMLIGRVHDKTGNYDLAFKIFIPQVIIAALFIFCVRERKAAP